MLPTAARVSSHRARATAAGAVRLGGAVERDRRSRPEEAVPGSAGAVARANRAGAAHSAAAAERPAPVPMAAWADSAVAQAAASEHQASPEPTEARPPARRAAAAL